MFCFKSADFKSKSCDASADSVLYIQLVELIKLLLNALTFNWSTTFTSLVVKVNGACSCLEKNIVLSYCHRDVIFPNITTLSLTFFLSCQMRQTWSPTSPLPSVWQGFGSKVKLLLPYVWPKGSPALQVLVLLCVGLLLTERLVNVLVPVYSKNIGK